MTEETKSPPIWWFQDDEKDATVSRMYDLITSAGGPGVVRVEFKEDGKGGLLWRVRPLTDAGKETLAEDGDCWFNKSHTCPPDC